MGGSCLAERLSHYVRLSDAERQSLDQLEEQDRSFRRGTLIIRENEAPRELFIVRSGWLHSSTVLNEKQLVSESNFIDRTGIETGWLPPPR